MRRAERVLVFADQPDWHVRSLVRAFRSAGAECAVAGLGAAGFAIGEDGRFDLPGVQGELPDLVFVKGIAAGSFEQVTLRLGLLHALGSVGVTVVNTARAIERCVDKSATSFVLAEAGVPTPPAWASQSPEQAAAILARATAAGHELVLKPLFGAQGRGLRRLRAGDSLPPPDEVQGVYYLQRFVTVDGKGWRDWRVVVSGGKGLRGPQSTGILAGRRDLIEGASLNSAPHTGIGRGMKVGKEEIVALVVALERYLKLDHEKEIAGWNEKARWLASQLQGIQGLTADYAVNTKGYADVDLSWDESVIPITHDELRRRLLAGSPRMTYDGTTVRVRQLDDAEITLVARRLREVFEAI